MIFLSKHVWIKKNRSKKNRSENLLIDFFWFEKIFFKNIFLHDKKLFGFFLDTYVEVKFRALSIYEVFRAIRARQTTLWSLARCWYKKTCFFVLNAVSGPYGLPGLWIFCTTIVGPWLSRRPTRETRSVWHKLTCFQGDFGWPWSDWRELVPA